MWTMRVHVVQTGTITGNETFMRGTRRSDAIKALISPKPFEFPVYAYVLEHDDGHIVIDTGLSSRAKGMPGFLKRIFVMPELTADDEIGPAMRRAGLRPEDVRLVIPTHLDVDHAGGVGHFPNAEIVVHRPEWEHSKTFGGKQRYQPKIWPEGWAPKVYDLDPETFGPFATSKKVTDKGDIRLVPIPGHSVAQVGVVVESDGVRLFFGADHMLRADWFVEDYNRGRLMMLGMLGNRSDAIETSEKIAEFVRSYPRWSSRRTTPTPRRTSPHARR
jgi:glyoxylase-like metal-dependent hydrolase (beta-lactamase superfamily II)